MKTTAAYTRKFPKQLFISQEKINAPSTQLLKRRKEENILFKIKKCSLWKYLKSLTFLKSLYASLVLTLSKVDLFFFGNGGHKFTEPNFTEIQEFGWEKDFKKVKRRIMKNIRINSWNEYTVCRKIRKFWTQLKRKESKKLKKEMEK